MVRPDICGKFVDQFDPTRLYLRRREAAKCISVSLGTLDSLIKRGVVPVIRPSPGVVLIRRGDLDEALNRFRVAAVGEEKS